MLKAVSGVNVDENGARVPGTLFPGLSRFQMAVTLRRVFPEGLDSSDLQEHEIPSHTHAYGCMISVDSVPPFSPLSVSFRSLASLAASFVPSAA